MIGSKDKSIISVAHLRSIFEEMQKYDITKIIVNRNEEKYEIWRKITREETIIKIPEKEIEKPISEAPEYAKKEEIKKKETTESASEKKEDKNIIEVKTPIVGTFYRASSPDSAPFVDIDSSVKKGDTLCIVEAMKSMNEIESEVTGIIEEILAENGKLVEYDQTLFKIKIS
ncbi:MAG: acetyl-CoA carboxylase biotin carboxyl carrier protein [Candidatus Cloacimonetes bacterium]|nr:acetyl-CoA carboxylase biotin carboxyl carrier protein [Candidatus Cloacimonadota bacterium]MBL7086885.1 acetyl-CoA carboxylase biotin carboxyl carrier protein [Candidatus Cloacimonadota bacterium]